MSTAPRQNANIRTLTCMITSRATEKFTWPNFLGHLRPHANLVDTLPIFVGWTESPMERDMQNAAKALQLCEAPE